MTKVLAIRAPGRDQGEFVLASLHEATEKKRIELDDVALVSHDDDGKVELHKTTGRFHRHKLDDTVLKQVAGLIESPVAMVLAKGDDATVDAVGARVRTLTDGDLKTYEVVDGELHEITGTGGSLDLPEEEGLLRESADELPMPNQIMIKMPLS